jgi:hypothetical protein
MVEVFEQAVASINAAAAQIKVLFIIASPLANG